MKKRPDTEGSCDAGPVRAPGVSTVFPVLLPVPARGRMLKGREKVAFLSRHARRALDISAAKTGAALSHYPKDEAGAPVPLNGVYWAVSHKPDYVAGVASGSPVGVDVETIRPFLPGLFGKIAVPVEWALVGGESIENFFRCWTAKEAVLKATGTGIKGLAQCRIAAVMDDARMAVDSMGHRWTVTHLFFGNHVAGVATGGGPVEWVLYGSAVPGDGTEKQRRQMAAGAGCKDA